MDYWQQWSGSAGELEDVEAKLPANARLWFIESGAGKIYNEVKFSPDDYLVFGRRDGGLAETVAGAASRTVAADSDVQRASAPM